MVRLAFEDGWFLQNLEKYFIRTNMHMTVLLRELEFNLLVQKHIS